MILEDKFRRDIKAVLGTSTDRAIVFFSLLEEFLPHVPTIDLLVMNGSDENTAAYIRMPKRSGRIATGYMSLGPTDARIPVFVRLEKPTGFNSNERRLVDSAIRHIGTAVQSLYERDKRAPDDFEAEGRHDYLSKTEVADSIASDFLEGTTTYKKVDFKGIIRFYKELAQQSYENKAITYGVVISPKLKAPWKYKARFPADVADEKRFHSMTDGYATCLGLDLTGRIVRVETLAPKGKKGEYYRPVWLEGMADRCNLKNVGLALTRSGSILVTWRRNLLLSYKSGKWTLWNHVDNVRIINKALTALRGSRPQYTRRLSGNIYRAALDVSFRRSGGLFVILNSQKRRALYQVVDTGDSLAGKNRTMGDKALGSWLHGMPILNLDRAVVSDLAALDGAMVCDRNGRIQSYGAVLKVDEKYVREHSGRNVQGSRSKAALSASAHGLSVKISSDGGIAVLSKGRKLLEVNK